MSESNVSEKELKILKEIAEKEISNIYKSLETLCISFPARVTGSKTLEKALDYLESYGKQVVPEDCFASEEVPNVSRWIRYGNFGLSPLDEINSAPTVDRLKNTVEEKCIIEIVVPEDTSEVFPVPYPLTRQIRVLANGLSVGTTPEGITGEIAFIATWEELDKRGAKGELQGKIVLYDYICFTKYEDLAGFRFFGATKAQKYGAIGAMVRSLTPNSSISGAHTGVCDSTATIPSVSVAIEEVEMLRRLSQRGFSFKATMILPCVRLDSSTIDANTKETSPIATLRTASSLPSLPVSRNLLFEMKGSELPNEIVLVGGHSDCWDCQYGCCQGAHDDGQAVVLSLEIVRLMYQYGLRPRRTVRAVLFTDEEIQHRGATVYREQHGSDRPTGQHEQHVVAIETDCGIGPVIGFSYKGDQEIYQKIQQLLGSTEVGQTIFAGKQANTSVNASSSTSSREKLVFQEGYIGVDIEPICVDCNIPGLLLKHSDDWWYESYFHYHHTPADTIDHINIDLLKENFLTLLVAVWTLANTQVDLRKK